MSLPIRRLETFQTYPVDSAVDKNLLVDAGYIYVRGRDQVKCFWCDGVLKRWNTGDDPWLEHAK